MRVFLSNLGCKLNQAEIERLERQLLADGHRLAERLEDAELHVVNSCTVTHQAARDSRKTARRASRVGPGIRTVLTGCYVDGSPEEAAALDGVDLLVPNRQKDRLLELVYGRFPELSPRGLPVPVSYVPLAAGHCRAAVKVEDGCNMRCAFCIIPTTRGRQRSRPVAEVVREAAALCEGGFREIVVTGVQISAYRDGSARLVELVHALLAGTALARLRLTSIAPWQFDRRLLELLRHPRVCRHVHLSLQSGCDATLRRMRRPYESVQFAELVAALRAAVPAIAVTTDVIVGFPGESDAEFEESLSFVAAMGFARTHVFTYSEREGTAAAELPEPVPPPVRRQRTQRLLEVARRAERTFWRERLEDDILEVVWESRTEAGWRGTSDNYVRVLAPPTAPLTTGAATRARPVRLLEDGLWAEPEEVREAPERRYQARMLRPAST